MKIVVIEPFYTGSHKKWIEGMQKHLPAEFTILSLPGRHWKWRMFGGAIPLAEQYKALNFSPDMILCSDMLNLTCFISLARVDRTTTKVAIYFHENQISYPWSVTDRDIELKRNNQYGFINYTSALVADVVFFNSNFHLTSFFKALRQLLSKMPDAKGLQTISSIIKKSSVLPLGLDLRRFDKHQHKTKNTKPIILWNHRWEYDKNPESFFHILFELKSQKIPFQVAVLGQHYNNKPLIFTKASQELKNHIVVFGYQKLFKDYAYWLWSSNICLVTSRQDFFGISTIESMYCNCIPILPNRLVFPEYILESDQSASLYSSDEEALTLLINKLKGPQPSSRQIPCFKI